MKFIPVLCDNPPYNVMIVGDGFGDVAVCTLWSEPSLVWKILQHKAPDIAKRICVLGMLRGVGLPIIESNLLYNPQIKYLLVCGTNMGKLTEKDFESLPVETIFIGELSMLNVPMLRPLQDSDEPRVNKVPFGNYEVKERDHNIPGHLIRGDNIRVVLTELNNLIVKFGTRETNDKGELRFEVSNVTTVIKSPESNLKFTDYHLNLMSKHVPDGIKYTYGNRLGGFIQQVTTTLKDNPRSRKSFHSLWNNFVDGKDSSPCLVSLMFVIRNSKLRLTAVFRTHNLNMAYEYNVSGLSFLMEQVANGVGVEVGELIITSLVLTSQVPLQYIKPKGYVMDPADSLVVSGKYHATGNRGRFTADSASELIQKLEAAGSVSTIGHVIYLLNELGV